MHAPNHQQAMQEARHGDAHDYRVGSPHLKHWKLYDRLVGILHEVVVCTSARGLPLTLLEVGAGHGGYTEPALAFGCAVTVTEMSRPSLARLSSRFALNSQFSAFFDRDGTLSVLGDRTFSIIVCASVLHHIPEYLAFVNGSALDHLAPGGTLLTIQDPSWYPGLKRRDLALAKAAYLSWRLTQGSYGRGVRTQLRRLRGVYDQHNPSDMSEYHVVRSGVDQERLSGALSDRFERVSLIPYWSTQSATWQRFGEAIGALNTFGLVASGRR